MKIAQVTPGLIPIPPNGWGAVEKIIWAYNLELKKLGHEVDILYSGDIHKDDYDVVHVHVSNLAIELANRGIPYVFTMHDHHVEVFGKGSFSYRENLEAINRSIFSMVPSEHLIDYFGNPDNLRYLPHGVDNDFFIPSILQEPVSHSLLCVGKNGYINDPKFDRKGFGYALKAAVKLDLPITIAGPSANSEFFDTIDTTYSKLEIKRDLTEDELKEEYKKHTIFIHPSIIEAGHPNLTLLEAMSAGLPIVGTYTGKEFKLEGIRRIERDVGQVVEGITEVMNNYQSFRSQAVDDAESLTWDKVVHRLDAYLCSEHQSQKFLNNHLSIYDTVLDSEVPNSRYVDKVYIINLKERDDRKKRIVSLIEQEIKQDSNFLNTEFEIVEATDVRYLSKEGLSEWTKENEYNLWQWKIKKDNYTFDGHDFNEWDTRDLSKGEIGCAISHYKVWQTAKQEGHKKVLLLEDDAVWKQGDLARGLGLANGHDYDIAYLGRIKPTISDEEVIDDNFVVPNFAYTTHAYILTDLGINKVLKAGLQNNIIAVDEFLCACISNHRRDDVSTLYPKTLKAIATKTYKGKSLGEGGCFCEQYGIDNKMESDVSYNRFFEYNFVDNAKVEITHSYIADDRFDCAFYIDGVETYKTELTDNTWASISSKRRLDIDIKISEQPSGEIISSHKYNDNNQRVLVWLDSRSLGDSLSWTPQVERYRKMSGAKVVLSTFWNHILEAQYPEMEFIKPGETAQNLYASYRIACVDNDTELHKTPWREVGLSRVCSDILNIPYEEEKCKVNPSNKPRPIKEKYVCISTSSTAGCKLWHGWQGVVDNLNSRGYKVVVIQKEPLDYMDLEGLDNVIFPENKDINEAINWLEYCEFFIGLSSGVSWLAHSLDKEVVMIAGFTEPFNEFPCIRLINKAKCYGCWHKHKFDRGDWDWCPEHKGTERQFECMKSIKIEDVIQALPIKV